jgi:hypothetical protein
MFFAMYVKHKKTNKENETNLNEDVVNKTIF